MKEILWIDNRPEFLEAHARSLRVAGYGVTLLASAEEAIRVLSQQRDRVSLIALDVLMGGSEFRGRSIQKGTAGLAVYNAIRDDLGITLPILFVTVVVDNDVVSQIRAMESQRGLAHHILNKPVRPSELTSTVRALIEPHQESDVDE